jgi:hypothetical protein
MHEMEIPTKLSNLTMMTLHETLAKVKLGNETGEKFSYYRNVKQGDGLSTTLFKMIIIFWEMTPCGSYKNLSLPEDDNHHSHRRGNLKSYTLFKVVLQTAIKKADKRGNIFTKLSQI